MRPGTVFSSVKATLWSGWPQCKIVAFDKTGTLTYGQPEVTEVIGAGVRYSRSQIYALVAAAENLSEHPLGKAVVRRCSKEKKVTICLLPRISGWNPVWESRRERLKAPKSSQAALR